MTDLSVNITLTARNRTNRPFGEAEKNVDRLRKKGRKLSNLELANRSARDVNELSANLARTGNQLTKVGRIGQNAIRSVLSPTVEYGKAVAEVTTLVDESKFSQEQIREITSGLSAEYGDLPVDQARALYQVISAGATTAGDATDVLRVSNQLAIGGVTNLTTAADGLTTVMNAYGDPTLSATDVSDALFVTMKQGKTTVGELSRSLGQIVPIASTLGVGIDEVGASMASLTAAGLNTRQASTAMRGLLSGVLKPSKGAQKQAKKLGINLSNASKDFPDFIAGLKQMRDDGRLSEKQLAKLFPNVRALGAAVVLTGAGNDKFNDTLDLMGTKSGETGKAVGKMENSLAQRGKKAEAQFELLKIQIGEELAPTIVQLLKDVTPLFKEFGDFVRDNPSLVKSFAKIALGVTAVATVLGPTLGLVSAITGTIGAFRVTKMVAGLAELQGASATAAAPVGKLKGKIGGMNAALLVAGAGVAGFTLGTVIDEATGASTAIADLLSNITGLDAKSRELIAAQGGRARTRGAGFGKAGESAGSKADLIATARAEVEKLRGQEGGVAAGILGASGGGTIKNPALERAESRLKFLETGKTGGQRAADFLRESNFGGSAVGRAFLGKEGAEQFQAALVIRVDQKGKISVDPDEAETTMDVSVDTGGGQ